MSESLSYTDWRYERTCARKVPYASIGAVSRVIMDLRRRHGARLTAYQCIFCGEWHLANASNSIRAPKAADN